MPKPAKSFEPGRGYSKEDWDAVDSPELTDEELAGMRPARDVLPPALYEALVKRGRGQRGPQKAPTKVSITMRLDKDVLEHFRSTGAGWQSRINEALRKVISA